VVGRIEHLDRQYQILVLAASDMRAVIAACDALELTADHGLRDALETAIAGCYARPFSESNTHGHLGNRWRPASGTSEREIHDWLLNERKMRYAHTDESGGRLALHHGDPDTGFDGLVELYVPFPRERLGPIRQRARGLREQLLEAAYELQQRLAAEAAG
jgi:hypothetical protein